MASQFIPIVQENLELSVQEELNNLEILAIANYGDLLVLSTAYRRIAICHLLNELNLVAYKKNLEESAKVFIKYARFVKAHHFCCFRFHVSPFFNLLNRLDETGYACLDYA